MGSQCHMTYQQGLERGDKVRQEDTWGKKRHRGPRWSLLGKLVLRSDQQNSWSQMELLTGGFIAAVDTGGSKKPGRGHRGSTDRVAACGRSGQKPDIFGGGFNGGPLQIQILATVIQRASWKPGSYSEKVFLCL